jgi:hypothetical protein
MDNMTFADLIAPVRDLRAGHDALEFWRWMVGTSAQPLLLTALGDVFIEEPSGAVAFLDTYEGHVQVVAPTRADWKQALQDSEKIETWFLPGLVGALRQGGLLLADGQCYSPKLPPVVGGTMDPDNFDVTDWRVHLAIGGQVCEQSSKLPPGTPITRFTTE